MKLFSVQPKEVYEQIINTGIFVCDPTKSEYFEDKNFANAYEWLVEKMNEKIGNPSNVKLPVWAWYKINGENKLPYFNDTLINYEDQYLLEIEIPDSQVVLTDYNLWHMPLNNCYANIEEDDDKWEEKEKWYASLSSDDKEKIKRKSWNCAFDTNGSYIQATFWELKKENIVQAYEIYKSIELEDVVFYAKNCTEEDRVKRGYTKENLPKLLENYVTNNINYNKILNVSKNTENLENLIKNNKGNLSDEEINLINEIINLYDLNKNFCLNLE